MQPILIEIGGVSIFAFGFFIATAYLLGMAWTMREAGKKGLDSGLVLEFGLYVLLAGLMGARVLHVLVHPGNITAEPWSIFRFWDGGLEFLGGALLGSAVLIVYLLRKKQDVLAWLDALAPGVALGLILGWTGCFFAGCGFGSPTDLPWGVTYTHPGSLAPLFVQVHPIQIYYALGSLAIFTVLVLFKNRPNMTGQLAVLFLILYAVLNTGIDFFRDGHQELVWLFSFNQIIYLVFFFTGMGLFLGRKNRAG